MKNKEYTFKIPMCAMSLNTAYHDIRQGRRSMRVKTKKCRDWEAELTGYMLTYGEKLKALRSHFREAQHCLYVEFTYYSKKFYTKKGSIHKRNIDVDNSNKIPVDVIFNKLLEIDDCFITDIYTKKRPSKHNYFILTIIVTNHSDLA